MKKFFLFFSLHPPPAVRVLRVDFQTISTWSFLLFTFFFLLKLIRPLVKGDSSYHFSSQSWSSKETIRKQKREKNWVESFLFHQLTSEKKEEEKVGHEILESAERKIIDDKLLLLGWMRKKSYDIDEEYWIRCDRVGEKNWYCWWEKAFSWISVLCGKIFTHFEFSFSSKIIFKFHASCTKISSKQDWKLFNCNFKRIPSWKKSHIAKVVHE